MVVGSEFIAQDDGGGAYPVGRDKSNVLPTSACFFLSRAGRSERGTRQLVLPITDRSDRGIGDFFGRSARGPPKPF